MEEQISEETDPRASGKILKGPKLGSYWRYRVGSHRIICNIQDGQLYVFVIEIEGSKPSLSISPKLISAI
jgi:mRNA interferase RelE/StbE